MQRVLQNRQMQLIPLNAVDGSCAAPAAGGASGLWAFLGWIAAAAKMAAAERRTSSVELRWLG